MYEVLKSQGYFFGQFLDTVGDGTGNTNGIVNASAVAVDFKYIVPAGNILLIDELIVGVKDNGVFTAGGYGGRAVLVNGIQIWYKRDAAQALVNRTLQRPIICNGCWASYATDYQQRLTSASDSMHVSVHKFGTPLALNPGGEYIVKLRDDFSALTGHTFRLHGTLIPL